MNYNKTIVKLKSTNYIEFPLSRILDYENYQELKEQSINWDLHSSIYQQGKSLYNYSDMFEKCKNYLLKECKISAKELSKWNDEISDEIIKACVYAYENSYMTELFDYWKNEVNKKVNEIIKDYFPDIKCKIMFYSSEDNTLHNEIKYNTNCIRLYISKNAESIKFFANELQSIYNREEIKGEYFSEAIQEYFEREVYTKSYKINLKYFDYYGTKGDYDEYMEYFKEYEEVSYSIKKQLKQKMFHVKQLIKNKVALIYR